MFNWISEIDKTTSRKLRVLIFPQVVLFYMVHVFVLQVEVGMIVVDEVAVDSGELMCLVMKIRLLLRMVVYNFLHGYATG